MKILNYWVVDHQFYVQDECSGGGLIGIFASRNEAIRVAQEVSRDPDIMVVVYQPVLFESAEERNLLIAAREGNLEAQIEIGLMGFDWMTLQENIFPI